MSEYMEFKENKVYPEELHTFLEKLAVTAAPLNGERNRQELCREYLKAHNVTGTFFDETGNLLIPFGNLSEGPVNIMMAHSDVVFKDQESLPYREDDSRIYAPGIGDNDVHVAALLNTAVQLSEMKAQPDKGCLLLVVNVGEEGLGNLRGSKAIAKKYGMRTGKMVTLDSLTPEIVVKSVGSVRYRVTVRTEGGHSYRDFGRKNAIERLARFVVLLYLQERMDGINATYNVGQITGGTSVNTIPQSASMLYEIRSDAPEAMEAMKFWFAINLDVMLKNRMENIEEVDGKKVFLVDIDEFMEKDRKLFEYTNGEVDVTVELIGERPCMGDVDSTSQEALIRKAISLQTKWYEDVPCTGSGSTDANSFQSLGIPSLCIGCCRGSGAHTYEEYVEKASLVPGLNLATDMACFLLEDLQ